MKKIFVLTMILVLSMAIMVQAADNVTLRVVTMFGGTDPVTEVFENTIKEFEANNPGVKIIDESATADDAYKIRVENDYIAGNEPDVTMYFTQAMGKPIIQTNRVMPLDKLLAEDPEWAGGLLDSALDQVRAEDGNLYAIPITGFYEGLIVNLDLFEKYDLELPTDWTKLERAIDVFKKNDIAPIAAGLGKIPHYNIEHFILKVAGAEGHSAGLVNGVDQGWVEGLNTIKDLYKEASFMRDALTTGWEESQNLFAAGRAGMIIEGSWAINTCMNDGANNVTIMPMPAKPGTAGNNSDMVAGFSSGFYLSREAYNDPNRKEIVLKLFKELTSKAFIKKAAEANGGLPAAKVTPEGLLQPYIDGINAVQNADNLVMPIDSQISPPAFAEIVKGVAYICAERKEAEEVLEAAREIELSAQ